MISSPSLARPLSVSLSSVNVIITRKKTELVSLSRTRAPAGPALRPSGALGSAAGGWDAHFLLRDTQGSKDTPHVPGWLLTLLSGSCWCVSVFYGRGMGPQENQAAPTSRCRVGSQRLPEVLEEGSQTPVVGLCCCHRPPGNQQTNASRPRSGKGGSGCKHHAYQSPHTVPAPKPPTRMPVNLSPEERCVSSCPQPRLPSCSHGGGEGGKMNGLVSFQRHRHRAGTA